MNVKKPYSLQEQVQAWEEEINQGNNALEVAHTILTIIENKASPARQTAGDKAKKFIPMKKELSDEDFERRVRAYYHL